MVKNNNFIQYKIFQFFNSLVAFTTSKQSFDLPNPRFTGDNPGLYKNSRKTLANLLEIRKSQLVFPRQTHTNCVLELNKIPLSEIKETDALITSQKGICLCVQTADCVPILLFDPVNSVVSAIHAGWRGTVKKIVEVAVLKMVSTYNSKPANILCAIGPSISVENYEVGNEVVEAVIANIPNSEITLVKNHAGNSKFNLWEANRQVLLKCGILSENIEILGECSFSVKEKYFSARREGINTGRIVSGIMLI